MVVAWLALVVASVLGALSLPPWVPMRVRVWLLYLAVISVLVLINSGVDHWLKRHNRQKPADWSGFEWIESHITAIRRVALLVLAVAMFAGQPFVSSRLTTLIAGSQPELKFYCGDSEIKVDGKTGVKYPSTSENNFGFPFIWLVNVGGTDAQELNGGIHFAERISGNGIVYSPDPEYPRAYYWQLKALHPMVPMYLPIFAASFEKAATPTVRVRLEVHYNGPSAVGVFTLQLIPTPPPYDSTVVPCARPSERLLKGLLADHDR